MIDIVRHHIGRRGTLPKSLYNQYKPPFRYPSIIKQNGKRQFRNEGEEIGFENREERIWYLQYSD